MPLAKDKRSWNYSDLEKKLTESEFNLVCIIGTLFVETNVDPERAPLVLRELAAELDKAIAAANRIWGENKNGHHV